MDANVLQHVKLSGLYPPAVGLGWSGFVAVMLLVTEQAGIWIAIVSTLLWMLLRGEPEPQGRTYRWSSWSSSVIMAIAVLVAVLGPPERTWAAGVALLSGVPAVVAMVLDRRTAERG